MPVRCSGSELLTGDGGGGAVAADSFVALKDTEVGLTRVKEPDMPLSTMPTSLAATPREGRKMHGDPPHRSRESSLFPTQAPRLFFCNVIIKVTDCGDHVLEFKLDTGLLLA